MDKFKDIFNKKVDFGELHKSNHENLWEALEVQIDQFEGRSKKHRWLYIYVAAASVVLVVMIAWFFMFDKPTLVVHHKAKVSNLDTASSIKEDVSKQNPSQGVIKKVMETPPDISKEDEQVPVFVKQDGYGHFTATMPEYFELQDHSMVVLNKDAELFYNNSYATHREVMLEGQGYFEVNHDPDHPFTVYFGNTHLVVLGTQFYIRSLPQDSVYTVAVVEGRVKVYNPYDRQYTILTKGQELILNQNPKVQLSNHISETSVLWKKGTLTFDKTKLKKVFHALNNEFGAKIRYDAKISECIFTGNLSGMGLNEALNFISITTNLVVENKDGQIFVTGNICD